MKITDEQSKAPANPNVSAGEIWWDTDTKTPYMVCNDMRGDWFLLCLGTGTMFGMPSTLEDIFGGFDKDFVKVSTELIVRTLDV